MGSIVVNTKAFSSAVSKAGMAVKSRTPKPVLTCVKIDASCNRLAVRGTDLEVSVQAFCDCDSDPMTVLVPYQRLADWLRLARGEVVTITEDAKGGVTLVSDRQRFRLDTMPVDEFPGSSEPKGTEWVPAARLLKSALRVVFACDPGDARYALGGVAFQVDGNIRVAAATDRHRVAIQELGDSEGAESVTIIVPSFAADKLLRIIPDEGEVVVVYSLNEFSVRCDSFVFTTRLLEGRFPSFREAIPTGKADASFSIPVDQFLHAVKASSLASTEESSGVRFAVADGELSMKSTGSGIGECESSVPVASDEKSHADFNPKYVTDFLSVCQSDATVKFDLRGPKRPCLITAGNGLSCIIMPLFLD